MLAARAGCQPNGILRHNSHQHQNAQHRGQREWAVRNDEGQNRATNLQNQAAGQQYAGYMALLRGEEAQRASDLNAFSTIAGGGASILRMYGGKG